MARRKYPLQESFWYFCILLCLWGCPKKDPLPKLGNTIFLKHLLDLGDGYLKIPNGWIKGKPSSPNKVYLLDSKETKLKIHIYHYGKPPTEIPLFQTNLARWINEFQRLEGQKELAWRIQIRHPQIRGAALWGTYQSKFDPNEKGYSSKRGGLPNYMVIAVMIPTQKGPYFVKILGPKTKVKKEIKNLAECINSYQKK